MGQRAFLIWFPVSSYPYCCSTSLAPNHPAEEHRDAQSDATDDRTRRRMTTPPAERTGPQEAATAPGLLSGRQRPSTPPPQDCRLARGIGRGSPRGCGPAPRVVSTTPCALSSPSPRSPSGAPRRPWRRCQPNSRTRTAVPALARGRSGWLRSSRGPWRRSASLCWCGINGMPSPNVPGPRTPKNPRRSATVAEGS
jgi:hypothetical protein